MMPLSCTPPALTLEQRIAILLEQKRSLQEEIRQRDLRIAELAGGPSTSTRPQKPTEPAPLEVQDPFRATAIRFNRHTGGVDTDGRPGDDQIKIILEPLDAEGDVVKRAGSLEIEIFHTAEDKIARWKFTTLEMSRNWLTGPLGLYGYVLRLPWPEGKRPAHDTLTLRAFFTTLDGRKLTTQTTVKIDLGTKQ